MMEEEDKEEMSNILNAIQSTEDESKIKQQKEQCNNNDVDDIDEQYINNNQDDNDRSEDSNKLNHAVDERDLEDDNNDTNANENAIINLKEEIESDKENKEAIPKEEEYKKKPDNQISEMIDLTQNLNINFELTKVSASKGKTLDINKAFDSDEDDDYSDGMFSNEKVGLLRSKSVFHHSDFEVISSIGSGSYGRVYKVKDKKSNSNDNDNDNDNNIKAIKVMEKKVMEGYKKLHQIYLENEILMDLKHPSIVSIHGAYEEKGKIFIVLEYLTKGDFSDFIRINYPLKDETIRFYAAELVNVLEYLRKNKVVHRDLKPENIMLDDNYHLKIIDFATAKIIGKFFDNHTMRFESNDKIIIDNEINQQNDDEDIDNYIETRDKRGHTFVGTAEYVSPEVLQDIPAEYGSDLWALGCMIYNMHTGSTPFKDKNQYLIFQNIKKNKIDYPSFLPEDVKDLISKILVHDPHQRLGAGEPGTPYDFKALKSHPYFAKINFTDLTYQAVPHNKDFRLNIAQSVNKGKRALFMDNDNKETSEEEKITIREHTKTIIPIKQAIVEKKSPWFHYNKRRIKLDSSPKIEYSDPERGLVKGVIFLNRDCKAKHVDTCIFELVTPKRTFKFKTNSESLVWVKSINDSIAKYAT